MPISFTIRANITFFRSPLHLKLRLVAHLCYITRIASIWREKMHGYLSADVVCSEERTVFLRANHELNFEFLETHNGQGQIYGHIFAPNGGCCAYHPSNIFAKGKMFTNMKLTFAAWDVYFSLFSRTTLWTNKHVFSSATVAKHSLILN